MSTQLCDQCTQGLKDEASFMMHVLNTPNLSVYNVELANEILYGTLRELYQVEDCDEQEEPIVHDYTWKAANPYDVTVTYTMPSQESATQTISDLGKVMQSQCNK